MKSLRFSVFVLAASVSCSFVGCGILFPPSGETGSAKLLAFSSQEEFEAYVASELTARRSSVAFESFNGVDSDDGGVGGDALSGSADGGAAPESPTSGEGGGDDGSQDFSGTTLQEAGVDESDVMKTDGSYIYLLDPESGEAVLRIASVEDPQNPSEMGELALEGYGQDLYLRGDSVVALTTTGGGYYYYGGGIAIDAEVVDVAVDPVSGDAVSGSSGGGSAGSAGVEDGADGAASTEPSTGQDAPVSSDEEPKPDDGGDIDGEPDVLIAPEPDFEYHYERPRTVVTIIDVSDRTNPTIVTTLKLDGTQTSSRVVDGVLHLVLANYQSYYVDVFPAIATSSFSVPEINAADVLPKFDREDADGSSDSGVALDWDAFYRPTDPDGFGMVYVASVDLDADAAVSATGIVAEPGNIYSSRSALYLTDTDYSFSGALRESTDIYKFAYQDRGATPVASGTVPGRVLNQYSMGEHEDHLRVATTVRGNFSFGGARTETSNNVYVLGETDGELLVTGSVEGIAPTESIQAARFVGDRGYVVTFEQIDPLFTLDLSDATNPRIVGELKVPGFSTYITEMDDDHLLAVGQYVPEPGTFGPWGVQLSIFDISDFANPVLMDSVILGQETGAWSEAVWNSKAFTYFKSQGLVALPVTINAGFGFEIDRPEVMEDEPIPVEPDGGIGDTPTTDGGSGMSEPGTGDGDSASGGTDGAAPPPDDTDVAVTDDFTVEQFTGVVVFSADAETGFAELGSLSTRFEEEGIYWSSWSRGVFIGDQVYAVTNRALRAGAVSDLEAATTKLVFGR